VTYSQAFSKTRNPEQTNVCQPTQCVHYLFVLF